MDLSSVAPNSTPPRCVNSQLVSLPPVGILNLLCLICIVFVCYAHLNISTWNLRDINVYYYYFVIIKLKHYASKATVISVYYSLIYPYVTYACTLWGNNYNAPLPQIVKFQNKAVRRYKWCSPNGINDSTLHILKTEHFVCFFMIISNMESFLNTCFISIWAT